MNEANATDDAPPAPAPSLQFGCAGTDPSTEAPCEAPATSEVDGLPLCGLHAEEFGAEARADVLEVAALYLSRWLRVARKELCNDELAWRLEAAREGVEAEMGRAYEATEQGGVHRRAPVRRPKFGGQRTDPYLPEGDATSSAEPTDGPARSQREWGGRTR